MKRVLTRNNCTRKEAERLTSKTSAWRLFSGKVDKLIVDYHKKDGKAVKKADFDINDIYKIAAKAVLSICPASHHDFEDIVSEGVVRFIMYENEKPTLGRLYMIAKFTALDWFKKRKEVIIEKLTQI